MSDGFGPYLAMRDSGAEWLGDVPAHWGWRRLKTLCEMQSGESITTESIEQVGEYPVYGGNGLRGFTSTYTHDGAHVLIGRQGALCGNVHFAHGRFWASEHAVVTTLQRDHVLEWFAFLLQAMNLNQYSIAAAQPGLSVDRVLNLSAPVPLECEQRAIARFLNHATNRIDHYVGTKEKLIALLEEQKQATILEVVTGRVDVCTGKPYDAYKASGVKWLGSIPAHWDVRPAKWHLREVDERSVTGAEEMLSVSHLTGVTPRSEKSVTMFEAESNVGHKLCEPGDVVINTMWAWMGALGIAQQPGLVSPSYAVYRPTEDSSLHSRYAEMMLRSAPFRCEYTRCSTGIRPSRLRLYPDMFLRIRLIAPPPEEQSAIIDFVAGETARCDRASKLMAEEVTALQEFRARLITDVVTGQIDVRQAAANLDEPFITGAIGVGRDNAEPNSVGTQHGIALEATS